MVKWTFPAASDTTNRNLMGYTSGKPLIVRTANFGYVALVTSGYDNGRNTGDGRGRLWMLNASTGAVIKVFKTTVGAAGSEAGLAQVSGFLEGDGTVRYVYGGDLLGNLWKFDLDQARRRRAHALAAGHAAQQQQPAATRDGTACTGAPGQHPHRAGRHRPHPGRDRLRPVPATDLLRDLRRQHADGRHAKSLVKRVYSRTNTTTGDGVITDANGRLANDASVTKVNWTTGRGWYMDMPSGEQANTRPAIGYASVAWVTNVTGANDCTASSYLYLTDIGSGFPARGRELHLDGAGRRPRTPPAV